MKRFFPLAIVFLLFILACQKKEATVNTEVKTQNIANTGSAPKPTFSNLARYAGPDYSQPISIDTANRMIGSYLASVGYPTKDNSLRSLSFDADTLLNYLNDPSHGKIATVKFMLAHRQEYINSGNYGVYAGMNPNAITLIIVGLNEENEYVFSQGVNVYDHFKPCPYECPEGINGATLLN